MVFLKIKDFNGDTYINLSKLQSIKVSASGFNPEERIVCLELENTSKIFSVDKNTDVDSLIFKIAFHATMSQFGKEDIVVDLEALKKG